MDQNKETRENGRSMKTIERRLGSGRQTVNSDG